MCYRPVYANSFHGKSMFFWLKQNSEMEALRITFFIHIDHQLFRKL
jgi:hypothetical protein